MSLTYTTHIKKEHRRGRERERGREGGKKDESDIVQLILFSSYEL